METLPSEVSRDSPEETVERIRKNKEQVLTLNITLWLEQMTVNWLETGFDSEVASAWMVLLATLLEWKMQFLLTKPAVEEDEELKYNREDHLEEYRMFKEAANTLQILAQERAKLIPREADDKLFGLKPEDRLEQTGLKDLLSAFQRLLAQEEPLVEELIEGEDYDLEQQMEYIKERVGLFDGRIRFEQLFRPNSSRALLVATFLALLELVRLGDLQIEQDRPYAEIWIGVKTDGVSDN